MSEKDQNTEKRSPLQLLAYLVGIGIILFILFGIGFSLWGIFATM